MPVSWAPERRRAKAELQNRMREQRQMGRLRREESARDDHANYMQNRRNAADAIGSQYGDAWRRAYLQNRTAGSVYGREAANASAQGMRTAQYVGQRNAFANDEAQRYGVKRTADAAYLSGQGDHAAGLGAYHTPFEGTRQMGIDAQARRDVAELQLEGVYDTNSTSRYGADADRASRAREAEAVERATAMEMMGSVGSNAPDRADVVTTEGGTIYDPNTGQAFTEDILNELADHQAEPIRMQRGIADLENAYSNEAADILEELTATYLAENEGATSADADAYFASGDGMAEYHRRLEAAIGGRRRPGEFAGGDINPLNRRFWRTSQTPFYVAQRLLGE